MSYICGTPCKNGSRYNGDGKLVCQNLVRIKGNKCPWHRNTTIPTAPIPTDKQLLNISQTHLKGDILTLGSRNSDRLDFHEVSVWGIVAALRAAYELGWTEREKL